MKRILFLITVSITSVFGAETSWQVYTNWPFDGDEAARRQNETASALGLKVEETIKLPDGATAKFRLIPAGKFLMGSPQTEKGHEGDERLHAERLTSNVSKRTFSAKLSELPDGVLVLDQELGVAPLLVWGRQLLEWSPGGYAKPKSFRKSATVQVLTPASTVAAIRAGYTPEVHDSAR